MIIDAVILGVQDGFECSELLQLVGTQVVHGVSRGLAFVLRVASLIVVVGDVDGVLLALTFAARTCILSSEALSHPNGTVTEPECIPVKVSIFKPICRI